MKIKNEFKQITFTSILLGLTSVVYADGNGAQSKSNPIAALFLGDKQPPNQENRFVFESSFIYWRADVDGVDPSLEGFTELQSSTEEFSNVNIIKNRDLDFQWDPGFKVGIGVIFGERDQWDLLLNWTWLQTKANRNQGNNNPITPIPVLATLEPQVNIESVTALDPSWSTDVLSTPCNSSETHWRLLYNTIDLELGRNFFLSRNLTVRPHVGVRGAWIHQHVKVNYNTFYFFPETMFSPESTEIDSSQFKGENEYDAAGLRGGVDLYWNFTKEFCVYGKLAGAILFGYFDVEETFSINSQFFQNSQSNLIETSENLTEFNSKVHRTRTNLQATLGLMWHRGFNDGKQHLFIGAGYEVNEWFQQNELRVIIGSEAGFFATQRNNGTLGLHGLTIDFRVDF